MEDDIHDWSAAHALHALDHLERQRFEQHLASCPGCRGEVDAFQEVAAQLPAPAMAASPDLRSRVLEAAPDRAATVLAGEGPTA